MLKKDKDLGIDDCQLYDDLMHSLPCKPIPRV